MDYLEKKLKVLKSTDLVRCKWVYNYINVENKLDGKYGLEDLLRMPLEGNDLDSSALYNEIYSIFVGVFQQASRKKEVDNLSIYIDKMNAAWRLYKLREKRKKQTNKKNSHFFLNKSVINHINKYAEQEGIDRNKAIELLLVSSIKNRTLPKDQVIVAREVLREFENVKENNKDLQDKISALEAKLDVQHRELLEINKRKLTEENIKNEMNN